jgi:hypothetical protein
MPTIYYALASTTSHNSAIGHRPRVMLICESDIIQAAAREARTEGSSIEDSDGVDWVESEDGMFKPARSLTREERLAASVNKLGDDGRIFEIFKTDAKGTAAFIDTADRYGVGDKARSLVDEVGVTLS